MVPLPSVRKRMARTEIVKEQPTRPKSQSYVLRRASMCTLDHLRARLHMIARTSGTDPPATLPRARLAHERSSRRNLRSNLACASRARPPQLGPLDQSQKRKATFFLATLFVSTLRLRFVTQLKAPEPSTSGRSIISCIPGYLLVDSLRLSYLIT